MKNRISVKAGEGYDILVERGCIKHTGELVKEISSAQKAAVITDSNVAGIYAANVISGLKASGFDTSLFTFEAGETSKCNSVLMKIYGFLSSNRITRSDIVVALGGGVTGDMAGYAAATYLRGIDVVQIPTTLLAQIDSSVGGKTAVNLDEGKNLVGAFHQPRLVICDPDTLRTLDSRVFNDGMAEAVKYGCIRDKALFDKIVSFGGADETLESIISRCIEIKRDIVQRDEFDHGERMLLNFGHTLGHAVEKAGGYKTYTHGEAVSIGMAAAARAGEINGNTLAGTAGSIVSALTKFKLPVSCDFNKKTLLDTIAVDKKRSGNSINIVLLHEIGNGFSLKIPVASLDRFFLWR